MEVVAERSDPGWYMVGAALIVAVSGVVANSKVQSSQPAQPTELQANMTTPDSQLEYALKLYEQGVRARAVELMKEIVTSHSASAAAAKAREVLAPPKP